MRHEEGPVGGGGSQGAELKQSRSHSMVLSLNRVGTRKVRPELTDRSEAGRLEVGDDR